MMLTLKEISARRVRLQNKREILELLKEYADGVLRDGADNERRAAIDEVLVDIDAVCVAPTLDEIEAIDGTEVGDGKAKKTGKEAKPKSKGKGKTGRH